MIILECRSVTYYHSHDETAFFEWLGRIKGVKRFYGRGRVLFIEVSPRISRTGLLALFALFVRYRISRRQLSQFAGTPSGKWVQSLGWYPEVFGRGQRRAG